jgi:GT2 family glycosyltransferase
MAVVMTVLEGLRSARAGGQLGIIAPMLSVAVIIPTRNRPERLRACIERLAGYMRVHPEMEVLVSDDGDAAVTAAFLRDMPFVRVVQGPGRGAAANRNHGAGATKAEFLIFIDDDCVPAEDLVERYLETAAAHPEVDVFEGRITRTGTPLGFADHCPENEVGGFLWSCNFATRRAAFVRVRGFDERYTVYGMEDIDFHRSVEEAGLKLMFVPQARVWHAIEQRSGVRGIHHSELTAILFQHIHGLNPQGKALGYVKSAISHWYRDLPQGLRSGRSKNIGQLAILTWYELKLAAVYALWPWHARAAALLFAPDCEGCGKVHALLVLPPGPKAELPYR